MSNSLFKLQRGVTGFFTKKIGAAQNKTSFSKFKSTCFEIARRNNARARNFTEAGIAPNFHSAMFVCEESNFAVVCNATSELVAFASTTDSASLDFIDVAAYAKLFKMNGYRVLSTDVLKTRLDEENCSSLDKSEIEQLKYWKSKTIGDVVFNWFD